MPARSEAIALLVVAALHLIVGMVHHYAHVIAGVQNTTLELLFILLVVTIALGWLYDMPVAMGWRDGPLAEEEVNAVPVIA